MAGLRLAGQILDATRDPVSGQAQPRGFAIVFAIAAALGDGGHLVHLFVCEPRPVPTPRGGALPPAAFSLRFANRDFRLLTLSLGAWNFGLSMTTAFALVYLKRDFGVTYSQLAALGIAAALGAIVTGYAFGEIMDRIGARKLGAILLSRPRSPCSPGSWSITPPYPPGRSSFRNRSPCFAWPASSAGQSPPPLFCASYG